jgi:hypothetical protein
MEQLSKQNKRRKFHKAVDKVKKGFEPKITNCKTKRGKVIGEESKVLERWEEYCKELLNKEVVDERMEEEEIRVEIVQEGKQRKEEEVNTDLPTRQEVEDHIQRTQNNQAPGEDNIAAELVKYGGKELLDAMCKWIRTIWETEKMPESWKLGIICPIYKKGDRLECENYRGITLLNVDYKILTSIINEKVKKVTERIIGEYQCGIRPDKSTTDQLYIIRQIMEKNWEH